MSADPIAAVLAGGASRRMGSDKAATPIAGRAMLDHVLAACTDAALDAIVVGGRAGVADRRPALSGPLAGIEAALLAADGRPLVVVAVDHPWVRAETLRRLAAKGTTAIPVDDGRLQVTCARYAAECLTPAIALLDDGPAPVRTILKRVEHERIDGAEWRTWGEDGRSWFSADTPEAIATGVERFGDPAAGRLTS